MTEHDPHALAAARADDADVNEGVNEVSDEADGADLPPWAKGHVKAKPQPLFSSFPYGTVAIMGAGMGLLGLGTIAAEIATDQLMTRGFPIPFFSAPLGVGAVLLGLIASRGRWHYGVGPILVALVYWGVFFYHAGV